MRLICMLAICLAVGCNGYRDLTEYTLDEDSFDTEAMAKIERESGLDLPGDAKGLAFHHKPPIDPIVFAKIRIPYDSRELIEKQIESLNFSGTHFPEDFANDMCKWWPTSLENVMLSKEAFNNGYYVELYLAKEEGDIILYIKYFTI